VLALVACSSCATTTPSVLPMLPPVTAQPTQLVTAGKFVWMDLVTQDVERAKEFYGALFGWTFDSGDGYTQVLRDKIPIAGIVGARDPKRASEWIGTLSVEDVDVTAKRVSDLGGVVERGPLDAPNRGRMAVVSDPEGALLLLLRATGGDPPDAEPAYRGWFWREIWTHDVAAATKFYQAIAGYEVESIEFDDAPYRLFRTKDDTPRAGIIEAPPHVHPLWLPYVRVKDAVATAARAEELGARIVTQDEDSAIIVDPTGAPLAVQVWTARADGDAETEAAR
jgi:predicted enzyme related to lactoylglutathione lyase